MSDIREFMGYEPTHCCVCGSRWEQACAPHCVNAYPTHPASELTGERGAAEGCGHLTEPNQPPPQPSFKGPGTP